MAEKRPAVQLKPGKVVGLKAVLPNGSEWFCYKAIPYAQPPVGALRFKPPVPLEKFDRHILDCGREGNVCLTNSYIPPNAVGSEDCLYVNVYTPVAPQDCLRSRLPVMIWIHGGAFCSGSGDSSIYNPRHLVQEGVIVVTCNYRLGPLGFLCLPSFQIYGNMGLKDQRLVLKWVHDNIRFFGGDPNNVTLFGESAGGASTHFHCLCEESSKYFHKAICQSGVATSSLVLQKDPEVKARRLAQFLGCRGNTDREIYEFLHFVSAEDIAFHQKGALTEYEQTLDSLYPFKPVIESSDSENPILTESVLDVLMKPNRISIPIIFGVTSEEAAYKANSLLNNIDKYIKEPARFVPESLCIPEDLMNPVARKITKFYTGDAEPTQDKAYDLTKIFSDNFYVIPTLLALELHSKYQQSSPLYFYRFAMESELNKFRDLWNVPENFRGACHADDICYLFSSSFFYTKAVKSGSRADQMRTVVCKLWTNFAKTGNPTPEGCGLSFVWKSYDRLNVNCLNLSDTIQMMDKPYHEKLEFWRDLYTRYNGSFLMPKLV
ncbi:esterase B1-like [Toxorhynchites rutilus septentrionalis]|uniref:esterase B1-like n=1 Tax=Toxorhynchites rutilus septentrionalis TaxID=329112 RepID=UPI00247AB8A8|nr:esterase B1-like [Toxorhynchites rutilus septentrionalis]